MTRQEELEYRRMCPYDAMGDYSALFVEEKEEKPDSVPDQEPMIKEAAF